MKCKVIREEEYITTKWSGGSTSQIMIKPENAVFSQMNFRWRISRATVEAQESSFTPMPGYHRILYLLSGGTVLHIVDREQKLVPGGQISFLGEQKVVSCGQGTDLNLIMAPEVNGRIERRILERGQQNFCLPEKVEECLLYLAEGEISLGQEQIETGNSIYCCCEEKGEEGHIMLEVSKSAEVICFFILG